MESAGRKLRTLLEEVDIVVAPGASDGLTAKLIEAAGFTAVHCTGGGISRSMGLPDLGQTTLTEVAGRIRGMAEVCPLPMIVDVDSGFGNVLNLMRTVRVMESAGAAAIHVEDMEVPPRSTDAAANLYPAEEAAQRVRAALRARQDPDFHVIARTNALVVGDLDEAIDRANRYADLGADLIFVEFFTSRAQIEAVARRVAAPKLIGLIHDSDETPPSAELAEMGYRIEIVAADPQLAAIHAIQALLTHLKSTGTTNGFDAKVTFAQRDAIIGTAQAKAILAESAPR